MRILVTGHQGYIGPVLGKHINGNQPTWELNGLDTGFFTSHMTGHDRGTFGFSKEIAGDVRSVSSDDLKGYDAIVQLAAISNDPIGHKFADATLDINTRSTIELARKARDAGCRRFVFASSCSMYGAGSNSPRTEEDELNPLTEYAKSKVKAEESLADLVDENFSVIALRFATACGASPRLRLDLVLNDFVVSGVYLGEIVVLSDGTPWRPLIHVEDMSRAIEWAILNDATGFTAVNAGSDSWTWQMGKLAEDVAEILGNNTTHSINFDAPADKRSYRVNFEKFGSLAPDHQPIKSFESAVTELAELVKVMDVEGETFRKSDYIRLHVLERLFDSGAIDQDLRWNS